MAKLPNGSDLFRSPEPRRIEGDIRQAMDRLFNLMNHAVDVAAEQVAAQASMKKMGMQI